HKNWIIEQLAIIQSARAEALPKFIHFPSIEQSWQIRYIQTDKRMRMLESPMQVLSIYGKVDNVDDVRKKLIGWFKIKAKEHLPAKLNSVCTRTKLEYTAIHIRDQKTQWGSCTA